MHQLAVSVEIQYHALPVSRPPINDNTGPTLSHSDQSALPEHNPDSPMAADSPAPTNPPLPDIPNERPLLDPEDDPAEVLDLESICSDSSEDILDYHEDDPVVPASFALPSSLPSPADDDPPTDPQVGDLQPLDGQGVPQKNVYGSSS